MATLTKALFKKYVWLIYTYGKISVALYGKIYLTGEVFLCPPRCSIGVIYLSIIYRTFLIWLIEFTIIYLCQSLLLNLIILSMIFGVLLNLCVILCQLHNVHRLQFWVLSFRIFLHFRLVVFRQLMMIQGLLLERYLGYVHKCLHGQIMLPHFRSFRL